MFEFTSDTANTCKGDAGGPALRQTASGVELLALHDTSWQTGCYAETRTQLGAVESRLDDIADWVALVTGTPAAAVGYMAGKDVVIGSCKGWLNRRTSDGYIKAIGQSWGNECEFWLERKVSGAGGHDWKRVSGAHNILNNSKTTSFLWNSGNVSSRVCMANYNLGLVECGEVSPFDDSFVASTTDGCGEVRFVDYGPGAPGGGNNDDYLVITDRCADGHGVMAYAWLNGRALGEKYNGNGNGASMVWDPLGNISRGDKIDIKVCLVDGASDRTPSKCNSANHRSQDG
jgi:hypothetical protein